MATLYSITLKSEAKGNPLQFLKLQVVAESQLKALEIGTKKAAQLDMQIQKIEEFYRINTSQTDGLVHVMNEKAFDFNILP